MPKVSIIIPTFNRLHLLKKAISSALSAGDAKVIVVDDGSSDGTPEYCSGLHEIKYIRLSKKVRTAGARNAGIQAATTEYVAFLDDDDWRLPDSLQEQVAILKQDPECGLVYGQFLAARHDGELFPDPPEPKKCPEGDIFPTLLRVNPLGCSTTVVRKSVFSDLGMFDISPAMYGIEDWDMWLRIAERFKIRALCRPVAVYRRPARTTKQWSSDVPLQFGRVADAYRNKWFHIPRAAELFSSGSMSKSELLDKVADKILYDMYTNSDGLYEKLRKTSVALRCHPAKLRQVSFYKTLVKSFVG